MVLELGFGAAAMGFRAAEMSLDLAWLARLGVVPLSWVCAQGRRRKRSERGKERPAPHSRVHPGRDPGRVGRVDGRKGGRDWMDGQVYASPAAPTRTPAGSSGV
jgi:hypothetical protein